MPENMKMVHINKGPWGVSQLILQKEMTRSKEITEHRPASKRVSVDIHNGAVIWWQAMDF